MIQDNEDLSTLIIKIAMKLLSFLFNLWKVYYCTILFKNEKMVKFMHDIWMKIFHKLMNFCNIVEV